MSRDTPLLLLKERSRPPFFPSQFEVYVNEDGQGPVYLADWVEPGALVFVIREIDPADPDDEQGDGIAFDIDAEQEEQLRRLLNERFVRREVNAAYLAGSKAVQA